MYQRFFKRILDIICALSALTVFCWLYVIIAVIVRIKLGGPVIFKQVRPGKKDKNGNEKLFTLYKFRTMSNECDKDGNLLPDEERTGKFGKWLRGTSLDEIPEAINILKGDMSVIGPRPQLVRDMVFMTDAQRARHNVRPGLSGLAQVKGKNTVLWEDKLSTDIEYIQNVSFAGDAKIVFRTVKYVFNPAGTDSVDSEFTPDLGDYLLENGKITKEEYEQKQQQAKKMLAEFAR